MYTQTQVCFTLTTFLAIQFATLVFGSNCNKAEVYPNPFQTKMSTVVTNGVTKVADCSTDNLSCGDVAPCPGKCTCDYDGTGSCDSETITAVNICGTGATNSVPALPVKMQSETFVFRTKNSDLWKNQLRYRITQDKIELNIQEVTPSDLGQHAVVAVNKFGFEGENTNIFKELLRVLSSSQIREIFQDETIRTIFRESVDISEILTK